ncbi:hypothetical protein RN001_013440 [Aquatica leii]|uniref:Arginyl-tRNA--protein transferase 1 n=1 Tax=Aquatica leii TaxID=1421715 RepID=A0AAN7SNQ9_9COLE|nr:hypothetical protein RN001_013440 [Aquatica leii]
MSSINIEKISIVHWFPELERHTCGYCKKENGAVSYGMWAEQLNIDDYQNLIDRGWRRSGMYCYKPIMDLTCCPQYTIRCNTLQFKISKSQKKIIKKFNKFVTDGSGFKDPVIGEPMDDVQHEHIIIKEKPNVSLDYNQLNVTALNDKIEDATEASSSASVEVLKIEVPKPMDKLPVGPNPNKPPSKKAKVLRLERKKQKLLAKGIVFEPNASKGNEVKSLEDFLKDIPENAKYKFKTKLIPSVHINNELENDKIIEFQLYKKYQMAVHNDPPDKCTITGFTRFLISSPLKSVRVRGNTSSVTYGTFHQQYWLDDKLIAVAVLDILPRCVSSVYFFYDPEYRFLTLGTYGSLREIQFVRSLHATVPAIQYYYMGFYIHSCPKMRYKGKINQSFLLCPETYNWFPIDDCITKLDKNKYSRLNDDPDAVDENLCTRADIDRIKVCVSYSFTLFGNYKHQYGEQDVFDNIGRLIGKKNASNLLFVSSKE